MMTSAPGGIALDVLSDGPVIEISSTTISDGSALRSTHTPPCPPAAAPEVPQKGR